MSPLRRSERGLRWVSHALVSGEMAASIENNQMLRLFPLITLSKKAEYMDG
jgi:hypothetical protein